MNAEELAANPQAAAGSCTTSTPTRCCRSRDATFDAAMCCVSVDYLTRPVEVFRDVGRVVRARRAVRVHVLEPLFPTKAIRGWLFTDDDDAPQIVADYFRRVRAIRSGAAAALHAARAPWRPALRSLGNGAARSVSLRRRGRGSRGGHRTGGKPRDTERWRRVARRRTDRRRDRGRARGVRPRARPGGAGAVHARVQRHDQHEGVAGDDRRSCSRSCRCFLALWLYGKIGRRRAGVGRPDAPARRHAHVPRHAARRVPLPLVARLRDRRRATRAGSGIRCSGARSTARSP